MKTKCVLLLVSLFLLPGVAAAAPVEVGTGVNTASVYIEWSDGFSVEFLVRFGLTESDTTTGLGLMDIIEAETELTTVRNDLGWGVFVDGIEYQGHSDVGFGGGELWWHYWENNTGSRTEWAMSATGASGRTVSHGDADGWVYGNGEAPTLAGANPFLAGYGQYVYDANDFATATAAYEPNGMYSDWLTGIPFDDSNAALGRPTVDTSGDDWFIAMDVNVPAVPVYPPFRAHELVYLGEGGSITLAFNHPVRDDEENPYGLDFIVFGNPYQIIGGDQGWINGDPRSVKVGPSGGSEPGIVSVSQDGQTWYSFTNDPNFMSDDPNFIKLAEDADDGPFCDGFAPTLGRVYTTDPCHVDTTLGDWNQWWAEPTNPTLPLDPSLTYASFEGMSIARIAETYGDSAGGRGYDLARLDLPADPDTGRKWFQYVRIDDAPGGGSPEVDAIADVSCPGDYRHPHPVGDLNGDYQVDQGDVAIVEGFLGQTIAEPSDRAASADLNEDGTVDQKDLDLVTANIGTRAWGASTTNE